jgi:hypothetical protein
MGGRAIIVKWRGREADRAFSLLFHRSRILVE